MSVISAKCALGSASAQSEHPRAEPDASSAAQCPLLYVTFLSSYHEPPGMIRNTWPLGAAGAQEIRTLKLERKPKQQIRKETNSGGGGGGLGVSLLLPWAGPHFLLRAGARSSWVTGGSLEREQGGEGWAPSRWRLRPHEGI